MLDILDEKADLIRLEPPGPEGQGVEFWITKQDVREYHQVKRQHSGGNWTLHRLASEGILTNFAARLQDEGTHCVFVSMILAAELKELSERARSAQSWEEYNSVFLNSNAQRKNFDTVRACFPDSREEEVYERLKRVDAESVSEPFLRTTIESRASTLVNGVPATVVDILAELALEQVHQELTAPEIWNHLDSRGFSRRHWDHDPHVLSAITDVNQRYLNFLRDQAVGGTAIPREEIQTVLGLLNEPGRKPGVMLTGEAGVGKSGVMYQVVDRLLETGTPALAFRVDRLRPTQLPDEVGEQLGLPGSPTNVLAAIARDRFCVLVIDQLDALSLASGRNTQSFDCINEIIRQTQAYPYMRVLIACRQFDLDNDYRLRQLAGSDDIAETVKVGPLAHDAVYGVVSRLGLDPDLLNAKQLNLLSIPLHLKLLSELVQDEEIRSLNFENVQDLYKRFWEYKQRVIERERLGRPVEWAKVIYALCDHMNESQTLSAPEYVLDEWGNDAEAMVSENVLVSENNRYSFFHEGFFDYSYARRFAGSGQGLLSLLLSDEQRLFRRAQVRQILLYLRDAEFERYIANLKEILANTEVRFHIKQVAVALLADVSQPGEQEWDVLSSFAGRDFNDPLTRHAWAVLHQPSWFQLVDSLGLVQQWLRDSDEEFIDRIVLLFRSLQRHFPDRVAEILEQFVGVSDRWDSRLMYMAQWADWSEGRRFLELMLHLLDEGVLDDARGPMAVNRDFWSLLYTLQAKRPSWGCEVVGHYFNRRYQLSHEAGQHNPFERNTGTIPESQFAETTLLKLASDAPESFVREVWPFMQAVIQDVALPERDGLRQDPIWSHRIFESVYGIRSALQKAMEIALSRLAMQDIDTYHSVIDPILDSPFETIQYLLIRSFASNGQDFANEAVDHLCQKPERLKIGYTSDTHWAARQLIESVSSYCSDEKLEKLEILLLGYYPEWEMSESGRRYFGHAQFTLLSGIEATRRSKETVKRLEELGRKFGQEEPEPPSPMRTGTVRSPIPDGAAEKMSDDQWLAAIRRHDNVNRNWQQDILVGGAVELSRVLENQVRENPARFAELVLRFPNDANPQYFEAVLRGISEANLDAEVVLRVCERCHLIDGSPVGRAICAPIANLTQVDLSFSALDLVAWYATKDPDPDEELWRTPASPSGDPYYGGGILEHGINTVRGSAAEAIAKLIESDPNRAAYLQPALVKMVQDSSIAVRSCVAQSLIPVLRYDRDLAVTLFKRLCDTEDALLKTHFVELFIYFGIQTHFGDLEQVVMRMLDSQDPEVATVGGRQACLAALDLDWAASLANSCLSGSEAQKIGAAQVVAANVLTATYRSFCEDSLISLFNDSSAEVRAEAARCFQRFEGPQLEGFDNLMLQFVSSEAFPDNCHFLFMALDQSTAKLPNVTLSSCERFIDVAGMEASDISTSQAGDADIVIKLTLRIYQQSTDDSTRARSLDLIDKYMELGTFGIDKALEDFER